jgi:hypothetical protein
MKIMKQLALLLCLVLLSSSASFGQSAEQLKKLYDSHDWLQLSEAVRKGKALAFYQGVAASISNDVANTEKNFHSVLESSSSTERDDAYSFLTQTYTIDFKAMRFDMH